MADQEQPFVINDRRKFRSTGELRDDLPPATEETSAPAAAEPEAVAAAPEQQPEEPQLPPEPTAEEIEQIKTVYESTAERLETAMRAQNLGSDPIPPMDFLRVIQSVYMTAMMQLGAGAQPGEKARVDLMGARNSVDMLKVLEEKTAGNLNEEENRLLTNALFELRMSFLQITDMLTRQAAARQQGGDAPLPPAPGGPKLVR